MFETLVRRLAVTARPLFRRNVYTIRSGLAAGLRRRGGLGFLPRALTPEERFLLSLDLSGQVIYDVGAYEGLFTLFFARAAGRGGAVFAWEPNPENARIVEDNVRLNGFERVRVFPMGIGQAAATLVLTFPKSEPARGSMEPEIARLVGEEPDAARLTVPIDSLDHQIEARSLPPPDFVKLDIEGMEMPALRGMKGTLARHAPVLYIEVHGADVRRKEANITAVADFVLRFGYKIRHVESGNEIGPGNLHTAREGHVYCVPEQPREASRSRSEART
jgi:FkbM family methyltransferase